MRNSVTLSWVLAVLFAAHPVAAEEPAKEALAVAAATPWLAAVDQGKYAESWKQAASLFKDSVKEEQWATAGAAARKPLGKLLSRKLKSKTYQTSAPGAPDGEYVVLVYDASYEHKKAAVETVTPMLDKDGKWRVSGYFIR